VAANIAETGSVIARKGPGKEEKEDLNLKKIQKKTTALSLINTVIATLV